MSRVLPLLENRGNRKLLSEWIQKRTEHEIVPFDEDDPFINQFDLCIIDGPSLRTHRRDLVTHRERCQPVFVPVLLLVPNERARQLSDGVWGYVDDIIWTSVGEQADSLDTFEFRGRMKSLLRTRSMSQTVFEDRQRLRVLHRVLRHNLRNSLNIVQGAAESIDGPRDERYIELIVQETDRLIGHSEKAQDIERILERSAQHEIALEERARQVVERFSEEYPASQISLTIHSPARVTSIVGISRAIEEIIQNAIIHDLSDEPSVSVEVDRENEFGIITIEDSGPTIPEQDRRVLRGDLEPTPLDHGSGVGLWLIVWTVRRSNGRLHYQSRENGGNRIEIQLPITPDDSS